MPPWIFHRYYKHKRYLPVPENQDSPEVKAIKERYYKKRNKYDEIALLGILSPFYAAFFGMAMIFYSFWALPEYPCERHLNSSGNYSRSIREGVSELEVKTYEEKRDRLTYIGVGGFCAIFAGGVLGCTITADILKSKAEKKRDEELEALEAQKDEEEI